MTAEQQRQKALTLFRIVHGKGDSGSEREFGCQNPALAEGWLRLARIVTNWENKARRNGLLLILKTP